MNIEDVKKVTVIGGGQMGRQIALTVAIHGYEAVVNDANPEVVADVKVWAKEYLEGRIAKGRMTKEEVAEINKRFNAETDLEVAAKDADIVIEAIIEDLEIKRDFFTKLNKIVRNDTIIGTNSSFLYSSMFADCVDNPARLANLHFFNPALVMRLTEVVEGPHTSKETVELLLEFSRRIDKDPIWVTKEIEGFVANRLLAAISNEALNLLEKEIATAEEIDTAAEKGLNYPMGPFKLMDLTGIDLSYMNSRRVFEDTGEKAAGYELLKEKYDKKEWGRKTGKGWYDYTK